MKTYPLIAFLLLLATSISSQTPQAKASIHDVVVNLNSAQPMDRVVVEMRSMTPVRIGTSSQLHLPPGVFLPNLIRIPTVAPSTTTTSTDRRFSFANVSPDLTAIGMRWSTRDSDYKASSPAKLARC